MSSGGIEYHKTDGQITADEIAKLAGADSGTPVLIRTTTQSLHDRISFVGTEIVEPSELGTIFRVSFVEEGGFVRAKRAGTIE